ITRAGGRLGAARNPGSPTRSLSSVVATTALQRCRCRRERLARWWKHGTQYYPHTRLEQHAKVLWPKPDLVLDRAGDQGAAMALAGPRGREVLALADRKRRRTPAHGLGCRAQRGHIARQLLGRAGLRALRYWPRRRCPGPRAERWRRIRYNALWHRRH